jgi:glycerophosphoryl diester phosphodiesterase
MFCRVSTVILAGLFIANTAICIAEPKAKVSQPLIGTITKEPIASYTPTSVVIAHRGASYDAPEETVPAYVLARDWGADYLEADIQRTKDGVLICLHDDKLNRTTDISKKFPDRADQPVSTFTWAELSTLDAGSWFNEKYSARARKEFVGLKIVTLDELITIAENGDNRPGIYLETKEASQFPGIEKDIATLLKKRNWIGEVKNPPEIKGSVKVGFTNARVIMQTFVPDSLKLLKQEMPTVPAIFLLWVDGGTLKSTTPDSKRGMLETFAKYAARLKIEPSEFEKWLKFAKDSGAVGIGPSSSATALADQSYFDLVQPWMNEKAHKMGLFVHAYTVDDAGDMQKFSDQGVDGFFTNRPDVGLKFYGRTPKLSKDEIWKTKVN